MTTRAIPNPELIHLLEPDPPLGTPTDEIDLAGVFGEILERANDLVPADEARIWVRDDTEEDRPPTLVAGAILGDDAEERIGEVVPADRGIAGSVLQTGRAGMAGVPSRSDPATAPRERSVLALPLAAADRTVGVLELLRAGGRSFDDRDQQLFEIFAQTISAWITNAVEAQRAKEMARRDDLTRLYNDRYLHRRLLEVLEEALDDDGECGLVFFDLDRFKSVNDTWGHLAGSGLLAEIGQLLRRVLPGSAVAARYGGDEFVIILPGSTEQESRWVAETIRKSIETQVFLENADLEDPTSVPALGVRGITCSLGLASLRADVLGILGPNAEMGAVKNEFLRVADQRMYVAKETGRNRAVSSDDDG